MDIVPGIPEWARDGVLVQQRGGILVELGGLRNIRGSHFDCNIHCWAEKLKIKIGLDLLERATKQSCSLKLLNFIVYFEQKNIRLL